MSFSTDSSSRGRRASAESNRPASALALLGPEDFEEARRTLVDFEQWATFDDYVADREGLMVGLCMGGQDTCLIETSLRDFESWRKRRRLEPSVANLDIYVNKTRRARNSAVSSFHAEGACEPSPALTPKDMESRARCDGGGYAAWLACLASFPIHGATPSRDIYSRLLREAWADRR